MDKNILICGDSFSANNSGWPRLINYRVINNSQNGVGEYKIYNQIKNHKKKFNKLIVCHTSPWRLHTLHHPIHSTNPDRPHNDFMLADLDYYKDNSKEIKHIYNHIKNYTDWNYVKDIYNLIVENLKQIPNSIHITFHHPEDTELVPNNFYDVWQKYPGDINHLNIIGNEIVAKRIQKLLQ